MGRDDDGELEKVSRELRERVGGEFRLAAETDEYWAMKQARRAGTLAEVAYDAMSRGDRVEIWTGETVFRGFIEHTRNDLLVVRGPVNVDVNLAAPILLRVIEPAARSGVDASRSGPASFAARLAELEQLDQVCDFITPFSRAEVVGQVTIRARDHVIVKSADMASTSGFSSLTELTNFSVGTSMPKSITSNPSAVSNVHRIVFPIL